MRDPFEDLVAEMSNDPMFIAHCEVNNRQWDEEASAELGMTVEELHNHLKLV